MLSIQIDTKSLELVNNIKLSFFARHMKSSFPLCTFNHAVRLLDTLVYVVFILGTFNVHFTYPSNYLSRGD